MYLMHSGFPPYKNAFYFQEPPFEIGNIYSSQTSMVDGESLSGLLLSKTRYCNYVGEGGLAEFIVKGRIKNIIDKQILLFKDAKYFIPKRGIATINGFHDYHGFCYVWEDENHTELFKIEGTLREKKFSPPENDHEHRLHFAFKAREAWATFRKSHPRETIT